MTGPDLLRLRHELSDRRLRCKKGTAQLRRIFLYFFCFFRIRRGSRFSALLSEYRRYRPPIPHLRLRPFLSAYGRPGKLPDNLFFPEMRENDRSFRRLRNAEDTGERCVPFPSVSERLFPRQCLRFRSISSSFSVMMNRFSFLIFYSLFFLFAEKKMPAVQKTVNIMKEIRIACRTATAEASARVIFPMVTATTVVTTAMLSV